MSDHISTWAGRNHHVTFNGFKGSDGMFRDLTRIRSQSGIERGLSATSLATRKINLHASLLQNIHHRFSNFGKETIHKAGDEELNGLHGFIVVQKAWYDSAPMNTFH